MGSLSRGCDDVAVPVSPTPTRRRTAVAVLASAVALTVSGCGSNDSASPLPSFGPTVRPPATTGAPGAVLDSITLRMDLLDVPQLPNGYAALNDPPPGSATGAGAKTDPAQCAKVLAPISDQVPGSVSQAIAQFSGPDFDSIDIDAAAYANGGAAQAFSKVQSLLRECTDYSGRDTDGESVKFRVGGLDQPNAGDASTSFRVNTTSQGLTLYSVVSVTLVGNTVVQLSLSSAKEPDPQQLSTLTTTQVRKLSGAAGP
ncbi:hypothetical protein AB0N05_31495 [Nocardia sp. NPDC051030]|uniref:hypothetical protein n=1 Tax=Nocardia sp. NPDC051030 TaxID=3155162 RepID=UPI0034478546